MKKLLAVCLLASGLSGCAAIKDAGNAVKDGVLAAPESVHNALQSIVSFAFDMLVTFFSHLFAPLLSSLGA